MTGGAGSDTFIVGAGDTVSELGEVGVDTVLATVTTYTLGLNVENLTFIGTGNFTGTGNSAKNVLTGGAGSDTLNAGSNTDTLIGGAGDDTMDGGIGNDLFVFGAGFGQDRIIGFDALPDLAGGQDRLDISALGITAEMFDSSVAISIAGADTLVQIGEDSMLLLGVNGVGNNAVTSADFLLYT
jgi:Ca2+-binding RTX toxin-like protein